LNLRGYAGYVVPEEVNNEIRYTYKGTTGGAINLELDFARFFNVKPKFTKNWLKLNTYLFADGGMINENTPQENLKFGSFRVDAGFGTALTIKKFGPLETVNPFTIRFDMPLFLNHPPYEEKDYFKFRYVVGVSRCF
jgi:hypothetical protein